jgi:hypothetical protein
MIGRGRGPKTVPGIDKRLENPVPSAALPSKFEATRPGEGADVIFADFLAIRSARGRAACAPDSTVMSFAHNDATLALMPAQPQKQNGIHLEKAQTNESSSHLDFMAVKQAMARHLEADVTDIVFGRSESTLGTMRRLGIVKGKMLENGFIPLPASYLEKIEAHTSRMRNTSDGEMCFAFQQERMNPAFEAEPDWTADKRRKSGHSAIHDDEPGTAGHVTSWRRSIEHCVFVLIALFFLAKCDSMMDWIDEVPTQLAEPVNHIAY